MQFKTSMLIAAGLAALIVPAVALAAGSVSAVRGELEAVDEESGLRGKFRIVDKVRDGETRQRMTVLVKGLSTDVADDEELSEVLLTVETADGTSIDVGAMRLRRGGRLATLRVDTRRDELPEGLANLRDLSGGRVIVSRDGADIMTGDVPAFVDPTGEPSEGGAAARGFARATVGEPFSDEAHAVLDIRISNTPRGVDESLRLFAAGLESDATYSVALTGEVEVLIGEFETRDRRSASGVGGVRLSTRRGDEIPGGSLTEIAGRTMEIRDADGTAVLSLEVPTIQ